MNELAAAESYLYAKLANDPTILASGITGVFSEGIPNQWPAPYIVWTQSGVTDVSAVGGIRINIQVDFLVRAIGQTRDFSTLRTAADQIDALLHRSTGTALGHAIQSCVRIAPYSLVQDQGDIEWRHYGGRYRMHVGS